MDFCMELPKGAASKLGEMGVESTLKQFKYMIQYRKIISSLNEEHKNLDSLRQSLQGWVDVESTKGNEISRNVLNWLSKEAEIEVELQSFYENKVNKNKKCFWGQCTNFAFNYSLGKQATEKIEDVTRLNEEGKQLPLISYRKAAPALGSTFIEDYKSLESRNKIIQVLIEKLKDDKLKRIGICGMGGVGKTTLVKELTKTVENKLFDKVVMAVVSQNPDYEKIQREIADCLGLKLKGQSNKGRGGEIFQRFKEYEDKKVKALIVLDDVWQELNFEWIGLSSQENQKCIKILFTSRDEKVCQKNRSQDNVQVSVLLEEEAWSLFREMAGDVVNIPDINQIARHVAKECGGLPLAIATVGRALSNEEKSTWEVALQQLRDSQSSSFSDMQECVYSRIELSFNFLGSVEHRSFLFLCGLFPEDFDIPVERVLRQGVGLGLFKTTDNVWKARKHINYLVSNLTKCFLLLGSKEPGCVKLHDVVRDVVLKIYSREELGVFVQSNTELKEVKQKQEKCLRMSVILNEEIELESSLECPTLEFLQVHSQRKKGDMTLWRENFIHEMTKLKVLSIQNLCIPKTFSHFHASIKASVNLHTLQLEGCDVGDISIIGKEMKKLEILSFANSNIEELPLEIGNLGFLKLLDLTGCDYLNFISPNVLERLSRLEEFYFRVKNFHWLLNREVLKELRILSSHLKVLEIKVRKVEILQGDMNFKNLEFFWVYIVPYDSYERRGYLEPNRLQLRSSDYNSIKGSMMSLQLVKKCEILILEKVKNLKNVISELDDCGLQCVKDLRLDSCPNVQCLLDCNLRPTFPLIMSLSLRNLVEMREIISAPDHHETTKSIIKFSNLEKLELKCLHKLIGFTNSSYLNEHHQPMHHGLSSTTKLTDSTNIEDGETSGSNPDGCRPSSVSAKLFSSDWIKQFPKLEIMVLQDCISIVMVFDLEGYSELIGNAQDFLFPQLRKVEISQMHSLLYVWGNVPYHIQGFHNLRFLAISSCNSLKYVFTTAIVRAITNLEELRVGSCEMIENIIVCSRNGKEDDTIKGDVATIGFSKLCYLSLTTLPKLVNICLDSVELEYPSLREFKINDCPMLEISLSPTDIHANEDNINKEEDDNIEVNSSSSSTCSPAGCSPFLSKFFHKGNTNKRINKEVTITRAPEDHIPSNFEMKMKKGKSHMPVLEDLCIVKCDLLEFVFFHKEKVNFLVPSHLKTIKIENCEKLKTIVASTENRKDVTNSFTQLVSLHLKDLPHLVKFSICGPYESWNNQQDKDECVDDDESIRCHLLMDDSLFPNLTSLLIDACNKISILISHLSLGSLEHLKKLEVRNCKNMQEIVSLEESLNKIVFNRLKHLILQELPNFKAFCLSSCDVFFPSLQKVEINNCPNMEVFSQGFTATPVLVDVTMKQSSLNIRGNIQKTDINDIVRGFKAFVASQGSKMLSWTMLCNEGHFIKNSEISIKDCHELPYLVPYNKIQMLQHVEELTVSYCDSLVEVIESGGGEGTRKGDVNTHYQLQNMTLVHLPKLNHIWKHDIVEVISFQKLTNIDVFGCHNLKNLFSYSISVSLVQLQKLKVSYCDIIEEIVTKEDKNTEGGNKVKTLFPKLEELRLSYLPNLKCVCSGDYDYDIPLCTVEVDKEFNNNDKVQISFPQLKELELGGVPELKCFCSGVYDYDIMVSSTNECPNMTTFPHGNVVVNTPNLHKLQWNWNDIQTLGDLNLTIYYLQNSKKYKVELQKLETFRDMDEELLGYIKRVTILHIVNCHKLLNCIPSNMMQLFSHVEYLRVRECECLEEIFESNDSILQFELKWVELYSLPKLKNIWKISGQILRFQQLGHIVIKQCNDLKYVFPDVSIATSLPKLNFIEVSDCEKIEEIIGNNCNHVETQQHKANKIILPKLGYIILEKLPSLKCFSQSSFPCYVEMPQFWRITIKECPEMKTFWYDGILYTPRLGRIYVENTVFDNNEDVNEVIQQNNK